MGLPNLTIVSRRLHPVFRRWSFSRTLNLGVLLLLEHDYARIEEGLSCAKRAEKLQPDSPERHFLAGKALFKLGRLREAGRNWSER